ncbi:hypothetical protein P879_06083 [Paragonimus westermani]|uniref:Uncharacterized protein n=1 Tax=Paragonimus westermani TaxID=34504 RepID=A0A8T0DQ80_9TREM|nr:hypothetical protein P879_06083 [Paragonimus westermani]
MSPAFGTRDKNVKATHYCSRLHDSSGRIRPREAGERFGGVCKHIVNDRHGKLATENHGFRSPSGLPEVYMIAQNLVPWATKRNLAHMQAIRELSFGANVMPLIVTECTTGSSRTVGSAIVTFPWNLCYSVGMGFSCTANYMESATSPSFIIVHCKSENFPTPSRWTREYNAVIQTPASTFKTSRVTHAGSSRLSAFNGPGLLASRKFARETFNQYASDMRGFLPTCPSNQLPPYFPICEEKPAFLVDPDAPTTSE